MKTENDVCERGSKGMQKKMHMKWVGVFLKGVQVLKAIRRFVDGLLIFTSTPITPMSGYMHDGI